MAIRGETQLFDFGLRETSIRFVLSVDPASSIQILLCGSSVYARADPLRVDGSPQRFTVNEHCYVARWLIWISFWIHRTGLQLFILVITHLLVG